MTLLDLYADGASRSNPGPAGIGVVIYKKGEEIHTISEYIGKATNNEAEYLALIKGLKYLIMEKELSVNCYLDSKLVIEQAQGSYRVKAENLIPLNLELKSLISQFHTIRFEHVPREKNKRADQLANYGIDSYKGKE
mgnify:CR=1 FL=1|jgi:ribonuclease HI|tara:strand:- start:821 stop:1231 length:411 start_codon:yes stop_codon:yes gene_type:complete